MHHPDTSFPTKFHNTLKVTELVHPLIFMVNYLVCCTNVVDMAWSVSQRVCVSYISPSHFMKHSVLDHFSL